jgi:hypothetical protein
MSIKLSNNLYKILAILVILLIAYIVFYSMYNSTREGLENSSGPDLAKANEVLLKKIEDLKHNLPASNEDYLKFIENLKIYNILNTTSELIKSTAIGNANTWQFTTFLDSDVIPYLKGSSTSTTTSSSSALPSMGF